MIDTSGMIPMLIQMLSDTDVKVRKEATYAVSNVTEGGTPEQLITNNTISVDINCK